MPSKRQTWIMTTILLALSSVFAFAPQAQGEQPAVSQAVVNDWIAQQASQYKGLFTSKDDSIKENAVLTEIFSDLDDGGRAFKAEFDALSDKPGADPGWRAVFIKACAARRAERLSFLHDENARFVFIKRQNLHGSHYAYTEGLSDANSERHFRPGSQLWMLEFTEDGEIKETLLLDCPHGVIRDPDVSFKGDYIVFAMKKSDLLDDYHLYKMDVETKEITQLTFGLGYADYEPCCLPNGDIIFNSTRCVQIVDCWYTEVSNLHRIAEDGKYLRRVTVDQVHDNYPTLTEKGQILYTRWDYNDRGQIYPQGLFQMGLEGTGQTAFYGNNSWFPTSILHARGIPGSSKVLCIFSGHHSRQRGKLGVLDPRMGTEENSGAQLVAPYRDTEAVHVDHYGQEGDQFCYPYPLSENDCLVSYRPNVGVREQDDSDPYGLYYMDFDGNRELLVPCDGNRSSVQAVQIKPKELLFERTSPTDPTLDYSTYYLQNVFIGPGLEGVDKSQVRSLRVIALEFRTNSIGRNGNHGPGGGALSSCPVSIGGGCWDVKKILGEATIYDDGSCCFRVPPLTPVYFQVIDVNGRAIQTMRSWSALQPGERFSCVGCHEDKNQTRTNIAGGITKAMRNGPQDLTPFYGEPRGFSFQQEIQPILDKHCTKCHDNENFSPSREDVRFYRNINSPEQLGLTCLTNPDAVWSASTKKPADGWNAVFPLPDGTDTKLGLGNIPFLEKHNPGWDSNLDKDVWTTTQLDLPDDYKPSPLYARLIFDDDVEMYINGQLVYQSKEFLKKYRLIELNVNPLKPGKNVIALHGSNPIGGGQGIDVSLWEQRSVTVPAEGQRPFSLKAAPVEDRVAKRIWTRSYVNLTSGFIPGDVKTDDKFYRGRQTAVNDWLCVQEAPPMLKPYHAGSVKSKLSHQFDGEFPHNGVKLSQEEKDKLNAWIDLLVPFCGTYEEANNWTEEDKKIAAYQQAKRDASDQLNADNFDAWLKSQTPRKHGKKKEFVIQGADDPYRALNAGMTPETKNNDVVWTFESPVLTDQIALSVPAKEDVRFTFDNGFTTVIRAGQTSVVFKPQKCSSVTSGSYVGELSIMGINFRVLREKKEDKK